MTALNTEVKLKQIRNVRFTVIFIGMTIASAVYFQLHVKFGSSLLNVNLADPLAILALAAVGWQIAVLRQPPQWRVSEFSLVILAFTALLVLGFLVGWARIGVTFWALNGRVVGWFILLGYLSAGYLVVAHGGGKWMRLLTETLVTSAVVIVLWHAVSRYLYQYGWDVGLDPPANFEGFSGNRNAFVFQLLTAVALLLAYSPVYHRYRRSHDSGLEINGLSTLREKGRGVWRYAFLLGTLLVGIIWTGSRAGIAVCAGMLLLATWVGLLKRHEIVSSFVAGFGLWTVFWLAERMFARPVGVEVMSEFWTLPVYANALACAVILLFATWRRLVNPKEVLAIVMGAVHRVVTSTVSSIEHAIRNLKPRSVAAAFLIVSAVSGGTWLARNMPPVAHEMPPVAHSTPPVTHNMPPVARSTPLVAHNTPPVADSTRPVAVRALRTDIGLQSALSNEVSNQERWETLKFGVELWRQSPIFGAGLGVFYEKSPARFGYSQVIHSTPLWVLTEFGMLGIGVLAWATFVLGRQAIPALRGKASQFSAGLLLVLLMFGLFSQVHEMFFQRTVWLVLGALLALPIRRSNNGD